MEDFDELGDTFQAATEFVRSNSSSFNSESLLTLYARYKQVNEGYCNTAKPGFFDFQGKQKWQAWSDLGKMDKTEAMSQYVAEVNKKHPEWESQLKSPDKAPKPIIQSSLGVSVSSMVKTDVEIDDELKTVYDWCKDGNTTMVSEVIDNHPKCVDDRDEEGMCLLHWACDRGDCAMVQVLLNKGADINIQDGDGQTALHFAVICEHPSVTSLLLKHGARTDIKDCDEQSVTDLETTTEIKNILAGASVR